MSPKSSHTQMTFKNKFLFSALLALFPAAGFPESLEPEKTYAVITGVLSWEDAASLESYPVENRKDAELHKTLLDAGVPADHMILLLDKQATRANILKAIEETGKKAGKGSLFIFYYAGHGLNEPGEGRFFANYDINTSSAALTGLSENDLFSAFENLRGKKLLLTADCCYSGFLGELAEKLGKKGVFAASATSASKSNTSTGNWTFSQTLLSALRGEPLADRNGDGLITLAELAQENSDAMRYAEKQMSGTYIPKKLKDFVLSGVSEKRGPKDCGEFETGEYVLDKDSAIARIKNCSGGNAELQYLTYSGKNLKKAGTGELKKILFRTWPAGSAVKVEWEGKFYDAKILKEENGFHYITYPGWDSSWDEWVMDDRIVRESSGTAVSIGVPAEKLEGEGLYNFYRVSPDLYRGAQPEEATGFSSLKKLGIKTVINLRDDHKDEDSAKKAGLNYLRIRFNSFKKPKDEQVLQFLKAVSDSKNAPFFVHCRRGADRTGIMVAIYRIAAQGWSKDEAIREMTDGGFKFNKTFYGSYIKYVKKLDVERLKKKISAGNDAPDN